MKPNLGDLAPDFELPAQDGSSIRLSSYRGRKNVVLYFYPKDDTSGCTKEACTFRDAYEAFQEAGAEVLGVSSDATESHSKFAQKYRLPFLLLSDRDGQVRKLYGVTATLGLIPGRATFLIDKQGQVRHLFSSQFRPEQHVKETLKVLKRIG